MGLRSWIFLLILTSASGLRAQQADVALASADTSAYTPDSLSIFELVDSLLMQLEQEEEASQLAIRLSYNSNVLSAGRTLGIENFGLSPGLSYFNRSGLYADLTSFWSKDFDPSYYLTVASIGYMKDFSKNLSIMAGYDRYFYNVSSEVYIPYRNTISITPIFDFKPFSLTANYSFYFGDQSAHRIMPGLSVTAQRKKVWKFDRIAISPSFYLLCGNEIVTTIEYDLPLTRLERLRNLRDYRTPYRTIINQKEVWGIMNYAISVPLSISFNKWSFSFNYIYNIPKALPGEPEALSESTYLTGSLMYIIDLPSWK